MSDTATPWRFRVVAHALVDPSELIAHPDNWRAHPDRQAAAMSGAIDELGFIGEVFVSQRSGRILDGHLRVALALNSGQATVPVGYIDCADDAEEDRVIASYDPIASLAIADADKQAALLARSPISSSALRDALDELIATAPKAARPGFVDDDEDAPAPDTCPIDVPEVWGVVVECATEQAQVELLERVADEGYTVRALLS